VVCSASGFNDAIYDLNAAFPGAYFNDITTGTSGGNAAIAGYDLVTGNGSPRAQLLIDRLESAGDKPINTQNLKWSASFTEAINKTGPLASAGAGFCQRHGRDCRHQPAGSGIHAAARPDTADAAAAVGRQQWRRRLGLVKQHRRLADHRVAVHAGGTAAAAEQ
jgi:hypothetical protein